ncbi:MAG TPA: GlyGly-CTERM sorting domain-containing protein, partial [Cellvibrio sp.]
GQLVFDNLPDLVIEATGIETSYRLPSVTATDLTDGALAATTTNLGPYKIGQNLIVWRVTNSQGKSAFANQLLTVRDTTPPVINLPPNIRVVATGEFTEVSLGEASAIDLVDGKIIPSTNTVGPFVTGNYSVVWTAVDSRGNKSTAIQTLVVEPRNVTSTSSSTANLSGGGGGAIGWFLMLILILTPRVRNNDCAAKIGKIALCLMICPRKAITKHSTV